MTELLRRLFAAVVLTAAILTLAGAGHFDACTETAARSSTPSTTSATCGYDAVASATTPAANSDVDAARGDRGLGMGSGAGTLSSATRLATKGPTKLYHYTDEAGEKAIRESGQLNASQGARRARHGPGQYLTDLGPESGLTRGQLARRLFGSPVAGGSKLDRCLVIDVCGLTVQNPPPNIFRVPGSAPLNVSGRILGSGPGPR